jgi:hypothetical protein
MQARGASVRARDGLILLVRALAPLSFTACRSPFFVNVVRLVMIDALACERCLSLRRLHIEAVTDEELVAGRLRVARALASSERLQFLKARMKSASALRELVESEIRRHEATAHSSAACQAYRD